MKLTNVQAEKVNLLVDKFNQAYTLNSRGTNIIEFVAPTGSGKTFMIANFIDKAIEINTQRENKPIVFILTTLSSAELPKQLENNFNKYKTYLQNNHKMIFERKESPSNDKKSVKDADYTFRVETNKVFILGESSFGSKRIYTEHGILDKFISEISNNYFVVFIRDEAHIGTDESKKTKKNEIFERFYAKMKQAANFQINMSATPNGEFEQIRISEQELYDDNIKLLKNMRYINQSLSEINTDAIEDLDLLDIACQKFKEIKQAYITEEGLIDNINPAMLIQVKDKLDKDADYDLKISAIIKKLEQYNLTWAKYFSSEKVDSSLRGNISLNDISKKSSDIDVIIFKVGPATGWDIPRACMLVQLRNVSSQNLNIQTIGRIKRNPRPDFNFKQDSTAFKYWIYSNVVDIDVIEASNRAVYKLNEDSVNNEFYVALINDEVNKDINLDLSEQIIDLIKQNQTRFLINYEHYLDVYKQKGFLPDEQKTIVDKQSNQSFQYIGLKINNIIELRKFIDNFYQKNSQLLEQKYIDAVNEYFNEHLSTYNNLMLWYAFAKSLFSEVKKTILSMRQAEIIKRNLREVKLEFSNKLPKEIFLDLNGINSEISFNETLIKYGYKAINKDLKKGEDPIHYFDSQNEIIFINSIIQLLKNEYDKYQDINVYRNPVNTGLNYQYYDEDYNVKNQFPDFILANKKDEILHQLNIEIKDFNNDPSPLKTQNIINSYQICYKDRNFSQPLKYIVSSLLIKVDKSNFSANKFIIAGGGSSDAKINEIIKQNANNNVNQTINWIYDLAKNIE
ncbi:DEAD/DEAH box helicase [Mycoplasmopsis phocirhinis]|uniref:DEAD/DEAH box helicase n=1 Tax=Mycoplasmopsis phocirhinis TaxID=142650 RepID=A0A4P6MLX8_9BACT|nr:DEAD/DEAH box helicase family protein [Mycoplasmopsis phocirhinis]QBF34625.1 DEAD/DEAH box helicase [Mycoplasmopsis phocirhinis]